MKSISKVFILSFFIVCGLASCSSTKSVSNCGVEPKGEARNQTELKKVGATVDDMKKHVSVDTGCPISSICLLQLSEQFGNAIYVVDVCGTTMKYRRTGSVFSKDGDNPYPHIQ